MDLNFFRNYAAHIRRPQNTESGEPELNNVGEKSQDKNAIITKVGMAPNQTHKDKSLFYDKFELRLRRHVWIKSM